MLELLDKIVDLIQNAGVYGALIGCLIIVFESILPVIPLAFFITINFLVFGELFGFIISWLFTCIGCVMSYIIFKNGFGDKLSNLTEDKKLLIKYTRLFKNISFTTLALIIALPFTPAFVVNIVAGVTKYDFKKYLGALLIGKLALVYFWGYVGTGLIESITNPQILIKIGLLLLGTYLISFVINKVLKLK